MPLDRWMVLKNTMRRLITSAWRQAVCRLTGHSPCLGPSSKGSSDQHLHLHIRSLLRTASREPGPASWSPWCDPPSLAVEPPQPWPGGTRLPIVGVWGAGAQAHGGLSLILTGICECCQRVRCDMSRRREAGLLGPFFALLLTC